MPSWTPEQFKTWIYEREARQSRKSRNDHNHPRQIPDAKPECKSGPALERPAAREAQSVERTRVRIVGSRVRPVDPDNFAGSCKSLIDGLCHAGLIPGDEPWRIILETEQVKVGRFADEKTVITIEIP